MTGPAPDTPREAEIRGQIQTLTTEQMETIQEASDAIARLQSQAVALQDKVVDDDTFAEITTDVNAIVDSANAAQEAFKQVGVTPTTPVASPGGKKGKK